MSSCIKLDPATTGLAFQTMKDAQFGPLLGISCLSEQKICSFDCVQCPQGPSVVRMSSIKKEIQFPTPQSIIEQLNQQTFEERDFALFDGGEPTLYPYLLDLAQLLKLHFPTKKILMKTNGAHLSDKKVLQAIKLFDHIILKLDAGSEFTYRKVTQPLVRHTLKQLLTDAKQLDKVVLETTFFQGSISNSTSEEIEEWFEVVGLIQPQSVRLKTLPLNHSSLGIEPVEDTKLYFIARELEKKKGIKAIVLD